MLPNYGNYSNMDLAEISRRTKIDTRRMRYVLEYGLIPNAGKSSKGRGSARQFSDPTAFLLTLAALMLDAGLRRPMVKFFAKDLADFFEEKAGDLDFNVTAPVAGRVFFIEIADGVNRRAGADIDQNTPWRQIKTGAAIESGYKPLVIIRFDLAHLVNLLFSPAKMDECQVP